MKKLCLLMLSVLLTASSVQTVYGADSTEETAVTSGDYVYDLNGIGTAVILEYIGAGGDVVIPDTLDGNTVTEIAADAFADLRGQTDGSEVTSVTIPGTVTSIGAGAFAGESLTDIFVDESNPSYCDVDGVLYTEDMRVLHQYPSGREDSAYTIPESVQSIGSYAFCYADHLTEMEIPDTVEAVYDVAFYDCANLETVRIGAGTIVIGCCSFYGESLTGIYVDDANEYYCDADGVLFTEDMTELLQYPAGRTDESYAIPDGIMYISSGAFMGAGHLTEIDIPRSVVVIDDEAFLNCGGLTEVTLPRGLEYLGNRAFYDCGSLSKAYFTGNALKLYMWGNEVFYGCPENLILYYSADNTSGWTNPTWKAPQGTVYSTDMFTPDLWEYRINADGKTASITGWNGYTADVVVPGTVDGYTVTAVAGYAFEGITLIKTVVLPDTVVSIGDYAFSDCNKMTSIDLPAGLTEIGDFAFSSCVKLEDFAMPDFLQTIGGNAFYNCSALTGLQFPEGMISIGREAFRYCTGLESVEMPDTVEFIGEAAFADCTSLETVIISAGLTELAPKLFSDCTSLVSAEIPASVKTVGNEAFYNCAGLTELTLDEGLTEIGGNAFRYCAGLTELVIPDTVTAIGSSAFASCTGLETAVLPENITSIPDAMFWNCTGLTEITIPGSVTAIGNYAFGGNTSLTGVTIPSSVTELGYHAFYGCTSLGFMLFRGDVPSTWGTGAAADCSADLLIGYPAGNTSGWTTPEWEADDGEIYRTVPWGKDGMIGDVNADSTVDEADGRILSRYFAGYDVSGELIRLDEADIDRDGSLTRRDCMILARYVDAWENYSLDWRE